MNKATSFYFFFFPKPLWSAKQNALDWAGFAEVGLDWAKLGKFMLASEQKNQFQQFF